MADVLSGRLKRSANVLAQRVKPDDPTTVLLHPQSGEYYTLDEVGSRIWELCDGTHSASEMAAIIAQEYDAPADVIQADVLDLLGDLFDEKLVESDT